MEKFDKLSGHAIPLRITNVDTDMIIPKQFLKTIKRTGLGEFLFYELRYDQDGNKISSFALNQDQYQGASILIAGKNFGCGSSREHAPQSLYRAGFRAIIAGNFAEIFFGNSINLGIPCVGMDAEDRASLAQWIEANAETKVTVDVDLLQVRAGNLTLPCKMRAGARDSLLNGAWAPLDELLSVSSEVDQVAKQLNYV